MLEIEKSFATRGLALIIDDVWDFEELTRLHLPSSGRSSLMLTSRAALPISAKYFSFRITGESNQAQEQAILASYVARDPAAKTVPAHVQVQLWCMRCYPPALVQGLCLERGFVSHMLGSQVSRYQK
jgi:hypothetical protein